MKKQTASLLFSLAAYALMSSAHANLLTNGGFETGDLSGWTPTMAGGWLIAPGANPHSGNFGVTAANAMAGGFAELAQTFNTVAGNQYTVDFWLRPLSGSGDTPSVFSAHVDTSPDTTLLASLTDAAALPSFAEFQSTFYATSTTTTLRLLFYQPLAGNLNNWALDDVSVNPTAVPIPAAAWLFGSALSGLLAFSRGKS